MKDFGIAKAMPGYENYVPKAMLLLKLLLNAARKTGQAPCLPECCC